MMESASFRKNVSFMIEIFTHSMTCDLLIFYINDVMIDIDSCISQRLPPVVIDISVGSGGQGAAAPKLGRHPFH